MNCLITNQETNQKTKNFPLSREGRELLPKIVARHNEKIYEAFVADKEGKGMSEKLLRKFAPKISIKYALGLIAANEPDMISTIAEVTGEVYSGASSTKRDGSEETLNRRF